MRLLSLIPCGFLASVLLWPSPAASQFYPARLDGSQLGAVPQASTGYVSTVIGRSGFSGSGAVVRDGRLLYTCAHVLYDRGRWASRVVFHRAYHGAAEPDDRNGVTVRGYHYVTGYADRGWYPYDFDRDFAVAYSYPGQVFGHPLGYFENGGAAAASAQDKIILGYPAYLDFNGADGGYFQHQTGPFKTAFSPESGPWYEARGVSTGPGNSGGPLLVKDGGDYLLAGVLISGAEPESGNDPGAYYAGVYALDSSAELAATSALASAAQPLSRSETGVLVSKPAKARDLKDGSPRWLRRNLRVAGKIGPIATYVGLDLSVTAPRRGDLDIYVRSPRGRVYTIATANPSDLGADFLLQNEDISSAFTGSKPRGKWAIFLRDAVAGFPSRFNSAALTVVGR